MAEHAGGHGTDHGHGHGVAHVHGEMDVAEHQKMFESYVKFWVWLFGATALVLIFLAIFNS